MSEEIFSLADIAELSTDEVAEIRFESLPAGVYGFKITEAELDDHENRDGDPRVKVTFKFEVMTVEGVTGKASRAPGFDPNDLIGKTHTEKLFIVTDEGQKKALEGIGRVKSFVWDLGCENKGVMREWVEATVDHEFVGKIVERPNPNDRTNPYAQLKLDKRKPA